MLPPILDMHIHLLALHPVDSDGGWFSPRRRRSLLVRILRYWIGLPRLDSDFDTAFRQLVLAQTSEADRLERQQGGGGFAGIALAFDLPHDVSGNRQRAEADFFVPNAYALRLADDAAHVSQPPFLLAGASIHPYREDALEALETAVNSGATLVKWLPTAQDIDPADPRAVAFARECRRLGLPLLVHTGSEAARNRHPSWNNPRFLEPLLKTEATIIAAHSGMRSLPREPCHFTAWADMLPHWPNLYGDTASLFGLRPRTLLRGLDRPAVAERLVHGSDWPVPNWPGWYWPGLGLREIRRLSRITNPLWRDAAAKRAAGLPEECFSRGWKLIKVRHKQR